jgi:hypothetical protein
MIHLKSFLLGLFAAYGIYYITKKEPDGKSILDELLENPRDFMHKVKDIALHDAVQTIKEEVS